MRPVLEVLPKPRRVPAFRQERDESVVCHPAKTADGVGEVSEFQSWVAFPRELDQLHPLVEVGPEYERNVPRPVPLLIEAGVSQPVEDH